MVPELELVEQTRRGDMAAMYTLYTATRDAAYFAAKAYLKSDGKELLSVLKNAYIRAFGRLEDLAPGRSFSEWLGSLVAQEALSALRAKRIHFFVKEEGGIVPDARELIPEAWIEQEQRRQEILGVIDGLPDPQRLALLLHYLGRMNVPEIAAAMGVEDRAADVHLSHARSSIRSAAPDAGAETGAEAPFLTRLLDLEASRARMRPDLTRSVYEETMLFLLSGGKAPAPESRNAAGAAAPGKKGRLAGMLPTLIIVALVLALCAGYFVRYQVNSRRQAEEALAKYQSAKDAGLIQIPSFADDGENGAADAQENPEEATSFTDGGVPQGEDGAFNGADQVDGEPS